MIRTIVESDNAEECGIYEKEAGVDSLENRESGSRVDTLLAMMEDSPSQRGTKRKVLLWRLSCVLGDNKYARNARSMLKPSGAI